MIFSHGPCLCPVDGGGKIVRLERCRVLLGRGLAMTACAFAVGLILHAAASGSEMEGPEALLKKQLAQLQKSKKLSVGSGYVSQFKQTLYSALRSKKRSSSGSLQYLPPGLFRWEVSEPRKETYVSTGEILWKYVPSARHAQSMPVTQAGLDFLQLLLEPSALESRYHIKEWKDLGSTQSMAKDEAGKNGAASFQQKPPAREGQLFVKLIPKDSTGSEEALFVIADRQTGHVTEIRIAFKNGNRNVIVFSGWRVEKMEKSAFNFVPPPGTAVDRM